MAAYEQKANKLSVDVKKFIADNNLDTKQVAQLMWLLFKAMRCMPWRGAIYKVKVNAMRLVARNVGVKTTIKNITGRDGKGFETIIFNDFDIEEDMDDLG